MHIGNSGGGQIAEPVGDLINDSLRRHRRDNEDPLRTMTVQLCRQFVQPPPPEDGALKQLFVDEIADVYGGT
jgi:hypothetical protein